MQPRPRQCNEINSILLSTFSSARILSPHLQTVFLIPFPTLECQSDSVLGEQRAAAAPRCLGTTRSTSAGFHHLLPILNREVTCK